MAAQEEEQKEKQDSEPVDNETTSNTDKLDPWSLEIRDFNELAFVEQRLENELGAELPEGEHDGFSEQTGEPYYKDIGIELDVVDISKITDREMSINQPLTVEIDQDGKKLDYFSQELSALQTLNSWLDETKLLYENQHLSSCHPQIYNNRDYGLIHHLIENTLNPEKTSMDANIIGPVTRERDDNWHISLPLPESEKNSNGHQHEETESASTPEQTEAIVGTGAFVLKELYEDRDYGIENGEGRVEIYPSNIKARQYRIILRSDDPRVLRYLQDQIDEAIEHYSS